MTQMYDRYENTVRRGEGLILPAGSSFPAGAVASEWRKKDTVSDGSFSQADKQDLATKGYRYFIIKVDFTIKEVGSIPKPR